MELFDLEIITQETVMFQDKAESVTAPASEGEVTILAHHAPFFSKLNQGQITIRKAGKQTELLIGQGFIDVSPDNKVTIMADSATRVEEIDTQKAKDAKTRAEELLSEKQKLSRTEILRVEASLRKAVLELKAVRRKRKTRSSFSSPS